MNIFADEKALIEYSAQFAKQVKAPAVIYLIGDLGVGKTTFARGFLQGLGITTPIKSPTYTLVEPYETKQLQIYHFDLYRIAHPDELFYIGIEEYFTPTSICLIEWPNKGVGVIPKADIECHLTLQGLGRGLTTVGIASGCISTVIIRK